MKLSRIMDRLRIMAILFFVALAAVALAGSPKKKMMILGVDGLDPKLLQKFMDEGTLPNFKQFIAEGDFKPLQTSMPPLSPVAWATFITGMDPGGHGIFDFVHRDPLTLDPYLSMAKAMPGEKKINVGSWVIPLSGDKIEQLRKGRAFWQILEDHGVPTTIFRIPANFPPVPSRGKSLSGMGTPDIRGTPGMFSFFTTNPPANADKITGGEVYPVKVMNHRVNARLIGPKNSFRRNPIPKTQPVQYENPPCAIDFTVYLDPENPVAKFAVQDHEFILREGEWSDWIRVDFKPVPHLVHVSAIGRFYLQEVRPDFKLYVSPLQINPEDPAMPISTPADWSRELCDNLGYFSTKELPEETKALTGGIFTGEEFWEQAQFVLDEQMSALDYQLDHFREGLLFVYFSTVDQGSHMLWRYMDRDHPGFVADEKLMGSIRAIYQRIDGALGRVRASLDPDTPLVVMSDHGFGPFYWGVNLNSFLADKGYVALRHPLQRQDYKYFGDVDWSRTQAYALGLNGLYVNLQGREKQGMVSSGKAYDELLDKLTANLLALRDPRNGKQPITLVTRTHRDFHGPHVDVGPDLIIGYNWGYRSSWESPLGEFPKDVIVDNKDPWSGDHSNDYRIVPGVLIANRKITLDQPALYDLTVAVLKEYGIEPLPEMIGKNCLAENKMLQHEDTKKAQSNK